MSTLTTPVKDLELTVSVKGKNKKIKVSPEQYYLLGEKIVMKHAELIKVADSNGFKVDKTELEFGVFHGPKNFCFVHRSYGTLDNGNMVDEIGEANPFNLETKISQQYPAIMSNKRAQDRLLIRLMGLEGQIYSDCEFSKLEIDDSSKSEVNDSKPAADKSDSKKEPGDKIKPDTNKSTDTDKPVENADGLKQSEDKKQPEDKNVVDGKTEEKESDDKNIGPKPDATAEEAMTITEAKGLLVDYGKYKKSPITLEELKKDHAEDFKWLRYTYASRSNSNPKMAKLKQGAILLDEQETA